METIERDYAAFGVQFVYVYKALAHPENSGYVQPFTLDERLLHVKEAERTLGSQFTWICDNMKNDLKHNLGNAPNSEFIIDPDGKVVRKRAWSSPASVRRDLEELIFPVEFPTRVSDLNMKTAPPPKVAASGVVKRVSRPSGAQALKLEPVMKKGALPFYAKLRAEVSESTLRNGEGKMYVGFHMDPLYHVHWNNLTKPIEVTFLWSVDGDKDVTSDDRVSPAKLVGPKPEVAADIDPREFLVDLKFDEDDRKPLRIKVKYFACNDEQGWCVPLTQEYVIHLERDRDGGRASNRRRR
ncbi:MAG: hypothetical protein CMJ78_00190 [Planctomycetaceae bacterium]|nr:hypothetical protein [Planctomycetaceae bacterium]